MHDKRPEEIEMLLDGKGPEMTAENKPFVRNEEIDGVGEEPKPVGGGGPDRQEGSLHAGRDMGCAHTGKEYGYGNADED